MNIKSSINLIRGILYLHEIIRCKSISRAAEENNMKASNLGVIINDLEKQTGTKLLKRTHLGSSPTAEGLRVAQYACTDFFRLSYAKKALQRQINL